MNAIDNYLEQKRLLQRFEQWSSLVGKQYSGGTHLNDPPQFGSVCTATGSLTIYHQEYFGAKNYHDLEKAFLPLLNNAMIKHSSILIQEIKTQLLKELNKSKQTALALSQELIND